MPLNEVPQPCRSDGEGRHPLPCVDRRGGRGNDAKTGECVQNPKMQLRPALGVPAHLQSHQRSQREQEIISSCAEDTALASFFHRKL